MLNFKKIKLNSSNVKGDFVCIDASGDNLKLAHLKTSSGKKEIANLLSRDIHGLPEAEISKIIKSSLSDMSVKNPYVIGAIPSPLAITRNIEVPSQNPGEIEEIVNLQASRLTPFAREDIIIDYINVGMYRRNYTKLLLITVARTLIKRQLDIFLAAGLKVDRVSFSAEAVAAVIPQFLRLDAQDAPINIVHIDSNFSDFIIAIKAKMIFVRGIPIGIEHLFAGKEQFQLRFAEELRKSLEAYKTEDVDKPPQMVVLTGAIEKIKELESLLNTSLHIPTASVSYFKHLPVSELEVSKVASLAERVSFLSVIAPLVASDEIKLNLIPEEIKFKKLLEEKGRDIVKSGILVMGVFVLICAILISNIYFKTVYVKTLNTKYNAKHSDAQKLEQDFSRVLAVRSYLSHRGYSLAVLDALYEVVPRNVVLSDVKFDRQGKFSIRGSADSMGTVFSLIDDMGKTSYFKDVKSKYTTKRKEGDRDVVDFEITSLLKEKG